MFQTRYGHPPCRRWKGLQCFEASGDSGKCLSATYDWSTSLVEESGDQHSTTCSKCGIGSDRLLFTFSTSLFLSLFHLYTSYYTSYSIMSLSSISQSQPSCTPKESRRHQPTTYQVSLPCRDLIPVKVKKLAQPLLLATAMMNRTLICVYFLAWIMYLHGPLGLVFVTDSMPKAWC